MAKNHSSVSPRKFYRNLWFLGFPKYRIGRDATVWTKCKGQWGIIVGWKLKKQTRREDDRFIVQLHHNGRSKTFLVHRLLLFAFVGPCPEGMEACHENGKPWDNRLENLRWDTDKANQADRTKHGTNMPGERHPMTDLTDATALEIKRAKGGNMEVARRFRVSEKQVRYIRGEGWKHLNHLV